MLGRPDYTPINAEEMAARLKVPPDQRRQLEKVLEQLERTGRIARIKKGSRYALPLDADLVPGRIRLNRRGAGWLEPENPNLKKIDIPATATGTAMNGDRVLVRRDSQVAPRVRQLSLQETGSVVRILDRARTQLVGTLERSKQFFYVIPDDPRLSHDVYVPPPTDVGRPARPGDKVVVELSEWQNRHVNPEGEIIEVLGPPDAEGVDMLSVIRNYNLPLHFPRHILEEARSLGDAIRSEDLVGRVDCRQHSVVTIDPPDAKDFDDAICLRRIDRSQWTLWVHIADVSSYVKPGTALDAEAEKRGNSTYLVDRVVPMLPEALSNGLCSLKPDVDRLTKCVEFRLNNQGRVLDAKFYSAVIHSKRRFNYKEVLTLLSREPQDEIERMLHHANTLAQMIRRARFKAGALDLNFPERKILLDENGRISRIETVENDVSHQLIEEFMLLANEAVAGRLMQLRAPAVYRIHEPPDQQKLEEFREEVLSHNVPCGDLTRRPEVQKLLEQLNKLSIGAALKISFLRSLMRARYSVEPLGHYGLAKKRYTHFTSPIRRYADLLVHRALFNQEKKLDRTKLHEVTDWISQTERNSDDAERDSRDVKLFAFLRKQLETGERVDYPGLVTDLRNFGFFVDVPDLAMSGLVHLSSLTDDFYVLEPSRGHLIGRRTRKRFRIGDRVLVRVEKVDTFKRQVDFSLVAEQQPSSRRPPERQQSRQRPERHSSGKRQSHHRDGKPNRSQRGQTRGPARNQGNSGRSGPA